MLNSLKTLPRVSLILVAACALFATVGLGQDGSDPEEPDAPPAQERPNLMRALGLRPEQVQQFRRFNQDWRPKRQAAAMQLRLANRELDQAIYADLLDEGQVRSKLAAFQEAQKEVARLRFEEELAIRKILDPEQLQRFRELRRRFAENRQQRILRRQDNQAQPSRQDRPRQRLSPRNRQQSPIN